MSFVLNQSHDTDEFPEIISFSRPKRVFLKERDDCLTQVHSLSDAIPVDILPVIVSAMVPKDFPASVERLQIFKNVKTLRSLRHHKLWKHLPTQSHGLIALERDREGSFSINEPDNPTSGCCSFLLIVCTRHVVTIVCDASDRNISHAMSNAGYSDVPAYGQILLRQRIHLRTVIVHLVPHVAMGDGPYLHPGTRIPGAWRMASEDSSIVLSSQLLNLDQNHC